MAQLGTGQSCIFIGPTRSGKTNLIAWLLMDATSVVVIDSKMHPSEWAAWGPQHGYVVTSNPDDILKHPKVIFQVAMTTLLDVGGWRSTDNAWTRALQNIMTRGNTIVVFDETVQTLPAGRPHPLAVQIYTQGAVWGISPWAGTQYASRIETMTIRSAVHCFCFRMNPYDLKLLQEKRGVNTSPLGTMQDYGFGYHLTNTPEFELSAPVDLVMN